MLSHGPPLCTQEWRLCSIKYAHDSKWPGSLLTIIHLMSFLARHMWSWGWALASGAAWGSFRAMLFQSPHCHLLDQRPRSSSRGWRGCSWDGQRPETLLHPCVTTGFMHMHMKDCYRSLITYVEADATYKRTALWTVLLNAVCAQVGVSLLISLLLWIYVVWHSSMWGSIDRRYQLIFFCLKNCWSGTAQPSSPAAQLSITGL